MPHILLTVARSRYATSAVMFFAIVLVETLILVVLNREMVNNLLFPIVQYLPMISLLWKSDPWAVVQMLATKSLLAVGHHDARSGLYLWTLEFDALSLLLHLLGAVLIAKCMGFMGFMGLQRRVLGWIISGTALVLFSHTYVTVLTHCAGPTWAGFVILYGLGVEKLELNSLWQWLFFTAGVMVVSFFALRVQSVAPATKT